MSITVGGHRTAVMAERAPTTLGGGDRAVDIVCSHAERGRPAPHPGCRSPACAGAEWTRVRTSRPMHNRAPAARRWR
jgi:hypothetical protein